MRKIEDPTALAGNKFTDGDAATALEATIVRADFLNILQDEASNVVIASGQTVDQSHSYGGSPANDTSQLLKAIRLLAGFKAVIGTTAECTHASLAALMADSGFTGGKVRVASSLTINAAQQITKNDVEIVFDPGVTWTHGTYANGLEITTGLRAKVTGGRFSGFTKGILIQSGASYAVVQGNRFVSCTTDVDDQDGSGITGPNIIE